MASTALARKALVYIPNGSTAEQARALLGGRFDVRVLEQHSVAGLDAVGAERVSVWGGDEALALALDAPDRIEALILEAPSAPLDAEVLSELQVPTLVVYGTQDSTVPPTTGRLFREKLPNCNFVLVYRAGHRVAEDRPEAFASLVADFVERRDAFIVSQKDALLHP